MNNFEARYQYTRAGSTARNTTSLQVKAESEAIAYKLAENNAKSKHPGCEVLILDLKKK